MPMSVSPYPKSYPESDSETTPPTLFTTNTVTNPTTQSILTSTKTEFSTNFSSDYQPTDSPRRGRVGHKIISHSFHSVRDNRRPRINSRSSDRSSSEPPAAHCLPHIDLDRTAIRSSGEKLLKTNKFDSEGDSHYSETGNGNPLVDAAASSSSSFQNQSYDRRLLEANSAVSTGTPSTNNPNVPHKSGSVAISGGHSNSRHASGDSSPKGESYFEYLCPPW